MLWGRLHPLLPLMWGWNPGLLVVQEKVKPQKMDISAERAPRATPVLGMGQFPARGVWEGAEPSCPKAGLDLGTGVLFLGALWAESPASPTPALLGFPSSQMGRNRDRGVVQALGLMTEPSLHCQHCPDKATSE